MKALVEVVRDKQVNNLTVGVVTGLAVFTFAQGVFGMLLAAVMKDTSQAWDWEVFGGQLVIFVLMLATAAIVRSYSK